MPEKKSIHSGHRDRVRERFCKDGLDGFADHNILELILFYSVPRKDTNELAHRLLESFGSFSAVLEADVDNLMQVDGITYNTAVLLKLFSSVPRRYFQSRYSVGTVIDDVAKAADYAASLFIGYDYEVAYVICLDGKNKIICCELYSKGSMNTTEISVSGIVECAIKHKAVKIILAHNHPAGTSRPSKNDVETTKKIKYVLSEMDIKLEDHIVVGSDGKCSSFRELDLLI